MATAQHFDVIVIGTGAGGGTLVYRLAPSGKPILMIERGDYVPRENGQLEYQGRESGGQIRDEGSLARCRWS